jgi:hypothetical protein
LQKKGYEYKATGGTEEAYYKKIDGVDFWVTAMTSTDHQGISVHNPKPGTYYFWMKNVGQTQTVALPMLNRWQLYKCPADMLTADGKNCKLYGYEGTDPDGGKNYFVKSSVVGYRPGTDKADSVYDFGQDNCKDNQTLVEYYLENEYLKSEEYICPKGCDNRDGAYIDGGVCLQ